MEILSFKRLPSTQRYLVEAIQKSRLEAPVAVMAQEQSDGIGSRDNRWDGERGNLFVSFAVNLSDLPDDLSLSSASIYFSFMMKKVLLRYRSGVWLKWPNDFYIDNRKIGGTITKKVGSSLVCGIGVNLKKNQIPYGALDIDIPAKTILESYFFELEKYPTWKQVFSEYRVEFELSRKFSVHIENSRKSLENASLCEDGSLLIEGKKVFSAR